MAVSDCLLLCDVIVPNTAQSHMSMSMFQVLLNNNWVIQKFHYTHPIQSFVIKWKITCSLEMSM